MSIGELRLDELKSILVAAGVDPDHDAAQDPERLRAILGMLDAAGLMRIDVRPQSIRLCLPVSPGGGQLVLPRLGSQRRPR